MGFVMENGYVYGIVVESVMTCPKHHAETGSRFRKIKIEELNVDPPDRPV